MLSIRLQRRGRRNYATFRIVVQEKQRNPRSRIQEILGSLNPHTKALQLDKERAAHWLSVGAQPSSRIHNLFVDQGIVQGEKLRTQGRRTKRAGEESQEAAPTPTTPPVAEKTPAPAA